MLFARTDVPFGGHVRFLYPWHNGLQGRTNLADRSSWLSPRLQRTATRVQAVAIVVAGVSEGVDAIGFGLKQVPVKSKDR